MPEKGPGSIAFRGSGVALADITDDTQPESSSAWILPELLGGGAGIGYRAGISARLSEPGIFRDEQEGRVWGTGCRMVTWDSL